MTTPTLTIPEHVQMPDGRYRLVVHVPDTAPEVFGGVVGTAVREMAVQLVDVDSGEGGMTQVEQQVATGATLYTVEWDADTTPEHQRTETRALIEQALAAAAAPDPEPEPITPPGTEL